MLSLRFGHLEKNLASGSKIEVDNFVFGRRNRQCPKRAQQFVRKVAECKPDIFWLWKDEFIKPKILKAIKRVSPKTKIVMWWGDQRGNISPPLIRARKGYLDALFMTNADAKQVKMFRGLGIKQVHTFYHSFSLDEFKLWKIPVKYQVFFGGTCFKPSKFPLSRLRARFINAVHRKFKLTVHGGGWSFPTKRWVLRPEYAKILRCADINVGINHYDVKRYYNRRLFESVASGRLHITYYVPGMEKHFKNHKHLVWFRSIDEGLKLIRYYLNHPEKRKAVAMQGRRFFIEHHSWPVRAKQFEKLIEKIV
jgi:hypothetical protein